MLHDRLITPLEKVKGSTLFVCVVRLGPIRSFADAVIPIRHSLIVAIRKRC